MQEDRIIIEVEVNAGQSAEQLARVKTRMAEIKAEQKEITKAIRDNGTVTAEQARRMAELQGELKKLTAEEKMYTNQIQLDTQKNKAYGDSITELGAQLAALKAEYRALSKADREGAAGKDMLKNIQELDDAVKKADFSMGDFGRNVGNYASAMLGLNSNVVNVANIFQGGFTNGIKAAGTSVKSFSKTLLATPVGWISMGLQVLLTVFDKLKEAFQRNDDAGTKLSASMAKMKPIINSVSQIFVGLANAVAKVVGWISEASTALAEMLIPGFKAAAAAEAELVKETDAIEQAERDHAEASAKRANESAKLEDEARNNTKLTTQERIDNLKKALDLERQDMEESRDIAKRKLEAAIREAEAIGDTSDETQKKISDLRVAYLNSETEFINGTRRLQKQLSSFTKEIDDEDKKRTEERKRRWEELKKSRQDAAKTELEELRKLEDMTFALIADITQRSIAETTARYEREIADLKTRLQTEKNLTIAARQAINQQILLLEKQKTAAVEAIRKQADEQAVKDAIEAQEKALKAQEEAIREQQQLVQLQYSNLAKQYANDLERSMQAAGDNVQKQAEANMVYAEQQLEMLRNMDAATRAVLFDTVADYEAAVLAAEAAITNARKDGYEAFKKQTEEIASTMQSVTGALSDLFEAAAGDSVAYEKFKKAMAIVDAMISMATTIAAATAVSTEGDPYTMAIRIAANVAAVTAQFAAVIKAIKAASVPSAPTFAQGGIVPGSNYSGDNVAVRTNSREMILTMEQQKHLFDLIAAGMPAMGINYDRMAAAISRGFEQAPAPILEYREFVRFSNRAKTINYNM